MTKLHDNNSNSDDTDSEIKLLREKYYGNDNGIIELDSSDESSDSEINKNKNVVVYCLDYSEDDLENETDIETNIKTNIASNIASTIPIKNPDSDSESDHSKTKDIILPKNLKNIKDTVTDFSSSDDLSCISNHEDNLILNINDSKNQNQELNIKSTNFGKDLWEVNYIDTYSKEKINRYSEDTSGICGICEKRGHKMDNCIRAGPTCIICGKDGHTKNVCKEVMCSYCFQSDHVIKKCPNRSKFTRNDCGRCGQMGHPEEICPDLWRQYKYTNKLFQSPVVKNICSQQKLTVYCANCGKCGHFTDQCGRNRMVSKFLGPPPIMEIVCFDRQDIYENSFLSYDYNLDKSAEDANAERDDDVPVMEMPSFLGNMDVSQINIDNSVLNELVNTSENSIIEKLNPNPVLSTFSPTPEIRHFNDKEKAHKLLELVESMPPLKENLLRKLFPEDTNDLSIINSGVRRKLRKKLKVLLFNGYLPQDPEITQERMESWLFEVSTGKQLSLKSKKNLLGSVSAALYSISDRILDQDTGLISEKEDESKEDCVEGNIENKQAVDDENEEHLTVDNMFMMDASDEEEEDQEKSELGSQGGHVIGDNDMQNMFSMDVSDEEEDDRKKSQLGSEKEHLTMQNMFVMDASDASGDNIKEEQFKKRNKKRKELKRLRNQVKCVKRDNPQSVMMQESVSNQNNQSQMPIYYTRSKKPRKSVTNSMNTSKKHMK